MIEVAKIRRDGGTQSRAQINEATIAEYAEAMEDPETVFPPIVVYHDGKDYWLADGFHRLAAWKRHGRAEVPAEVRQGDRRRAVLHACAANAIHGLRRTNADKRRVVLTLIEDDEWAMWSNRKVARQCGVSEKLVRDVRNSICDKNADSPVRTVERNGAAYQQDTSRIGSSICDKNADSPVRTVERNGAAYQQDTSRIGSSICDKNADSPVRTVERNRQALMPVPRTPPRNRTHTRNDSS